MQTNPPTRYLNSFLRHQRSWGIGLLIGWFTINTIILATNKVMEFQRMGKSIPLWEPFAWEISSSVMILLLIPIAVFINDRWLAQFDLKARLGLHLLASLPFSIIHVTGMVWLRYACYHLLNTQYDFGDIATEFLYEYRKDLQTYFTLLLVIFGYRLLVYRLQGEASYLAAGDEHEEEENKTSAPLPERLLIKKLDREFLIEINKIEWIEASGNYANLYLKNSVYPMRITMDKLEQALPENFIRIHRSNIVNLEHIDNIQLLDTGDYQIRLHSQKMLTLSRRYREKFKRKLSLV